MTTLGKTITKLGSFSLICCVVLWKTTSFEFARPFATFIDDVSQSESSYFAPTMLCIVLTLAFLLITKTVRIGFQATIRLNTRMAVVMAEASRLAWWALIISSIFYLIPLVATIAVYGQPLFVIQRNILAWVCLWAYLLSAELLVRCIEKFFTNKYIAIVLVTAGSAILPHLMVTHTIPVIPIFFRPTEITTIIFYIALLLIAFGLRLFAGLTEDYQ